MSEVETSEAVEPVVEEAVTETVAEPVVETVVEAEDVGEATDWRTQWAGEDKELLSFLGRYHSKDAALKKFKETHDDIRNGKYRKPLGENPSDEDMAQWRKELGVPEATEDYYKSLPEALVVGDDDKPLVDQFLAAMHEQNAPPSVVSAAIETYYGIVEEQLAEEANIAREAEAAGVEALRAEWGADYKRNLNVVHAHLETLPTEVAEIFRNGRGADGVPIGYKPEALKWLASMALEANPLSTVVPGTGATQASAITDEIAKIEGIMRTDRTQYNKDETMQARYRDLLMAREKLGG